MKRGNFEVWKFELPDGVSTIEEKEIFVSSHRELREASRARDKAELSINYGYVEIFNRESQKWV